MRDESGVSFGHHVTGVVYVADPPEARTSVVLESLVAVYHAPSGMTHLLVSPAPEILAALGEGAGDAEAVLGRLARDHEVAGPDALAAVAARLEELEAGGLVRRA